ncbi:hypothetical protein Gotur_029486 [Gossypium turneri]
MSLRNTSTKDQAPKTESGMGCCSKPVKGISGCFDPMSADKSGKSSNDSKLKQAEDSLRTVSDEENSNLFHILWAVHTKSSRWLEEEEGGMSWKSKAWAVAATTVTAAEVSKEKKLCLWSSAKHHHQAAINNVVGSSQRERPSLSAASTCSRRRDREEMRHQSEESLRTIMYLSCWGSN